MKTYNYADLSEEARANACKRPKMDFESVFSIITPIIDDVEQRGDEALREYTQKFDNAELEAVHLEPGTMQITLEERTKRAIDTAYQNIRKFHEAQQPPSVTVRTMEGVECSQESRPIERVGLYVPGGTALLPSTALMLAVPAQIAGCKQVVLASPPNEEGGIAPEIIYIAQKCGVDLILKAGGAQAVAAMAFGTESVPKVDKIFGPGNQYVTAAKMLLQNHECMISIDMPAGPSEVLVIADQTANPKYVAADLLSQAEHGEDSQVVVVATKGFPFAQLEDELNKQMMTLPRKKQSEKALANGFVMAVDTLEEAFEFSNTYAPEHLILNCVDAASFKDRVQNAGSVFVGEWSPESVGDYASGTNHTLPTYGYARMYSGVSLDAFMKKVTFQELTKEGLKRISPTVQTLADLEGLEAHKQAVAKRMEDLQ